MRGEDSSPAKSSVALNGSPPHARGRQQLALCASPPSRITPACAGKTSSAPPLLACIWDHPRMRGEDLGLDGSHRLLYGSPPHARGRHPVPFDRVPLARITPACAGKTRSACPSSGLCPDHPRMRGEDTRLRADFPVGAGSPPHARGRLDGEFVPAALFGITPACAGKTYCKPVGVERVTDHPRMRGEDDKVELDELGFKGSPPHARGRPDSSVHVEVGRRITPACAGKTLTKRIMQGPRQGSPPHARGRRLCDEAHSDEARITPACAGKTSWIALHSSRSSDHPRMRGEDEAD